MSGLRRRSLGCLFVLVVAGLVLVASSGVWLPVIGTSLDRSGPPRKADIAVVLGGDHFGNRILKAAQLAREGYVPKVLVSGPSGEYGFYESELAISFAVKRGFPESMFLPFPNEARSTRDEAAAIVPQLRRIGVRNFLLVTSDFHTRRAGRLFRAAGPDLEMAVVASPDQEFRLDRWWRIREGQKAVVQEWSKTIATFFGI